MQREQPFDLQVVYVRTGPAQELGVFDSPYRLAGKRASAHGHAVASSSARRTSTVARWRRYSDDAFMSLGGSVPTSARMAASGADAPLTTASSTAVARRGVDPMLMSAMPVVPLRTAATPTIAQSWARRLNFWNDQPAPVI